MLLRFIFLMLGLILSIVYSTAYASEKQSLRDCSHPVYPVDEFFGELWSFNSDKVSAAYSVFAAASYDAYLPLDNKDKLLKPQILAKIGWNYLNWNNNSYRFENSFTGLSFDVYTKETEACVFLLLAIRGTDDLKDWWSNSAWITQFIPLKNQYREMDEQLKIVLKYAKDKFPGKNIKSVSTGHSLGGGISEHLAKCQNGFSAVVFDTSIVDMSAACNEKSVIIEIYDKNEILTKARNIIAEPRYKHKNNSFLATYGINPYELKNRKSIVQHGMDGMVFAMLRAPLDCKLQKKNKCEINNFMREQHTPYQSLLLCESYRKLGGNYNDFREVCTETNP